MSATSSTAETFNGSAPALLPCPDWTKIQPCEHFVQFYETDAFLALSVADFLSSSLLRGGSAVVLARQSIREALDSHLERHGVDVATAKAEGNYVALDAAETLQTFMVDGCPDPKLFEKSVGGLIAQMTADGREIRAFGEMVALLWSDGNRNAAIRLEQLWNGLGKIQKFTLYCAYPLSNFHEEADGEPFLHICHEHSRVLPAESYIAKEKSEADRLRLIASLQQKAAALESEVAARKRATEQLAKANQELERRVSERTAKLEETIAELESYSYSISHDMRSPVRAMGANIQSFLKECRPRLAPSEIEMLERVQRSSGRLDMLIRDVLAYSKVSQGTMSLNEVNLASVVADIVQEQPDEMRKLITVHQPLNNVFGHEACVSQCLSNLLANALKFVSPDRVPRISIRSEKLADMVRVTVSDNGIGIKPEHYNRLFKMFGRIYPKKMYDGTGMGLCIVKRAASRMGGQAGFTSEFGKGSDFWFELRAANL